MLKAHKIQAEIDKLTAELWKHQGKCKHNKATGEYGSDTGNYDGRDSYWINANCPTCLMRWTIDDDQEYRDFGRTHEVINPRSNIG
jgi:hypothetical protein